VAEIKQINPKEHKGFAGYPRPFFEEGDDKMFGQELIGVKAADFFLGVNGQNTVYPLSQTFKQDTPILIRIISGCFKNNTNTSGIAVQAPYAVKGFRANQ
jgi:hypothetical protein